MKKIINCLIISILFVGCTHYEAMPTNELKGHHLIGLWKMSIEPYYYQITCDGYLSFQRPSSYLYADQTGKGYAITEIHEDGIVTGPIFRSKFEVTKWPTEENGRTVMEIDGRTWYLAKTFNCE